MTPQTRRRISTFARGTERRYAPRTTALLGLVWTAPDVGRISHQPSSALRDELRRRREPGDAQNSVVDRVRVGEPAVTQRLRELAALLVDDAGLEVPDLVAPFVSLERVPLAIPRQGREGHAMTGLRHEVVVVGQSHGRADGPDDRCRVLDEVLEADRDESSGLRPVLEGELRRVAPMLSGQPQLLLVGDLASPARRLPAHSAEAHRV